MGKCVFCGNFGLLENSHVISKFHIKEFNMLALQRGSDGPLTKIVSSEGDKNVNLQSGLKGYLLCGSCEDTRSVFERAFAKEFKTNRKHLNYKEFLFQDNSLYCITSLHTNKYIDDLFNEIGYDIKFNSFEIDYIKEVSFFYGNDFEKIVKHLLFTLYMLSFEPRVGNINLNKKELKSLYYLINKQNLVFNDLTSAKICLFKINDYITVSKKSEIITKIELSEYILSSEIKKIECNMYQFVIPGFLVIVQLGIKVKQDCLSLRDYNNGWGVMVPCTNGFLAENVVTTLLKYRRVKNII